VAGSQLPPGKVEGWWEATWVTEADTVAAVVAAGGRPVVLTAWPADGAALSGLAGLVLTGGGDVDPARYGAVPHAAVDGVDAARDERELRLVAEALATGLPVLAICRGLQLLNVALGGTLRQHLGDDASLGSHRPEDGQGYVFHAVQTVPGSLVDRIAGGRLGACASHHHQAVERLGTGLVATAEAADGLVEAAEWGGPDRRFVLGVQWHPEVNAAVDEGQASLFRCFVEACAGEGYRGEVS
jgi:gamma-glutamyl-gamma-aminobutyrate hydrolase PuuD